MADELRLGGLGLLEEFPVPPVPLSAQTTPTVPVPLETTPTVPIPFETTPTVPVPLDANLQILGGDLF